MTVHVDPDLATLSLDQRRAIACALLCGAGGATEVGLTPLQTELVHAFAHACLGVDLDTHPPDPLTVDEFAAVMGPVDDHTGHRIAQFFLVLELVAHPLTPAVVEQAEAYMHAVGVCNDLLVLACDYAQQAYGLALKDLERKGYFSDFADKQGVEKHMHVHRKLTRPFEVVDDDPELVAEWRALEHLPADTLGRRIWEFYVSHGFVFPGAPGSVSPTLAQHDWVHVLAD